MDRHRISDPNGVMRRRLLHWAAAQPYCAWLESCGSDVDRYGKYEYILGIATGLDADVYHDLADLEDAMRHEKMAWRFGFLSYELKAEIEPRLETDLPSSVEFPNMGMFKADVVISKERGSDEIVFEHGWSEQVMKAIAMAAVHKGGVSGFSGFESNFDKAEYCATVERLREHIREGDVYEINLSQCFSATGIIHSPAALYEALVEKSPVPFAGYCKWKGLHLLCASPERFLRLQRHNIITQPIKGTAARGNSPEADAQMAYRLRNSIKEQAENVMIVDLSRNDLHRSCEIGSVAVPHLFEVQTFPQVHHLVSTVTGRKRRDVHAIQVIRNTFPPGSMTGAPKVRACELIAEYEGLSRGVYSGALGYIAPSDDFDFNVVIRSLVYDAGAHQMSYHVGGAITWDSDPEAEYAETLLKAKAIAGLFGG
jgi:para-aminobenzoate synthetase component I